MTTLVFLFAAEANLDGGWQLGWAIDDHGDRWPVILDSHIGDGPVLLGPALEHAAPHDRLD